FRAEEERPTNRCLRQVEEISSSVEARIEADVVRAQQEVARNVELQGGQKVELSREEYNAIGAGRSFRPRRAAADQGVEAEVGDPGSGRLEDRARILGLGFGDGDGKAQGPVGVHARGDVEGYRAAYRVDDPHRVRI